MYIDDTISIHALCEEGDVTGTAEKPAPYISIHALCEEGDEGIKITPHAKAISIHALCEEGDMVECKVTLTIEISIHALCEEGDGFPWSSCSFATRFLSTPSARRATWFADDFCQPVYISIHALCEEGDVGRCVWSIIKAISIHALCEEGDCRTAAALAATRRFLSTPSARRATSGLPVPRLWLWNFYPRPLRGGRRYGHSGPPEFQ